MCFKIEKNPNSVISSHALIYLVHEFSPMALLIEWLAFLINLHLIVRSSWFASQVEFFHLLTGILRNHNGNGNGNIAKQKN